LQGRAGLTDAFVTTLSWNTGTSQLSYGYSTVLGGIDNGIRTKNADSQNWQIAQALPESDHSDDPCSLPRHPHDRLRLRRLLRLRGAVERPGSSFEYLYDKAGNRIW
jgi:hypothetical protein